MHQFCEGVDQCVLFLLPEVGPDHFDSDSNHRLELLLLFFRMNQYQTEGEKDTILYVQSGQGEDCSVFRRQKATPSLLQPPFPFSHHPERENDQIFVFRGAEASVGILK
jgi:hypothetical protein